MDNHIETKLYKNMNKRELSLDFLKKNGLAILKQENKKMSDIQEAEFESQKVSDIYKQMTVELINYGYEEFRFQGSDTSGCILLAKKKSSNIRYVIKGIHTKNNNADSHEKQLQCDNEIKMLRECSGSPYTLNLLDVKKGQEMVYLILNENKGTLEQLLEEQGGKLSTFSAIKYAKDIAEGICHIHKNGYFVQNINLGKILIDSNNNAVINNFGLGDQKYVLENSLYSAPEIEQNYQEKYAKDNIQVSSSPSKRSDAFSFGYMIYSLLFGETELQRYENKKETPLDLSNLSDSSKNKEFLQNIISSLTKFNPSQRIQISDSFFMLKGMLSLELNLDQKNNKLCMGNSEELFLNKQTKNIEDQNSEIQIIENLLEQFVIDQKEIEDSGEELSKNKDLQNQIKNLQHQIKSKDEEFLDLTKQLSSQKEDLENQKQKYETENNNLFEKISLKDQEMENLKKELDQQRISFKKLQDQLKNMDNLQKYLNSEKENLENQNQKYEIENNNLIEQISLKDQQMKHLKKELDQQRTSIKNQNALLKYIESLQDELESEKQNNEMNYQLQLLTTKKSVYQGAGWYCDTCGYYFGVLYGYYYGCQKFFNCVKCNRRTQHTLQS